jgi:hypothetical protein
MKLLSAWWFLFSYLALHSRAGTVAPGGPCSTSGNRLDPLTHKFMSECDDKSFCSGINGTCTPRRCRRDEFPFGYDAGESVPPLCPEDQFCPDDGGGCRALLAVGELCDLSRDEQCSPPVVWQDLKSSFNFNGSVCVGGVCLWVELYV